MKHKAGIYCRISQDRTGAGLGVERQEQDCRDLAAALGWDVTDTYVDDDLSAFTGKRRPNYERALADVESGRVTALIAWHTDRLHRSPVELERFIGICEPRCVPTRTVKAGELDLSTASGRMVARISGAVARHESEQKGERLRRQRQQAQAQGRWIGGRRPFGFEPDGTTVRETEAAAIRDATHRILTGDSVRSLVAEWNRGGLTTSAGTEWNGSKVRQMLMRPRNAGLIGKGDRIVGPAVWAPVVDLETWQALVALLNDPARRTHHGTSLRLLGSGVFRCWCGQPVRSGGNTATGRPRYACSVVQSHVRRSADPIDRLVLGVTEAVLVRENVALIAPAADVAPLRERLSVLRARAEEIASSFGDPDSDMTAAQFSIANERVQSGIRSLEAEIGRGSAGSVLAGVADVADPAEAFRALSVERKRAIIDLLMTVVIQPGRPGSQSGGGYFDPDTVVIEPREQ